VVATGLVALCFAEAGSRVPQSGGPYAYIEVALGPWVGFICGVLLWLGLTLAMAAVATVFADALATLVPPFAGPAARICLLVALFAALAWLNIRGTALGSRVNGISTLAKLIPLIAFVLIGLFHIHPANLVITTLPPLGTVGEAGLLLIFAFFGMESALQVSGEVTNPARTVPRAIALALSGVALLYVSVQLVAQGVLGSALSAPETAKAPLAAAAEQFAGPAGGTLILIAMALSTFGFMTGMMLSTPRTLFALAADGFFPRPLARVHPGYRTPHVAIAVQGVIVCLIAITGSYVKLAILADVAILLVYLACCVAADRLRRRNVGAAGKPFVMPWGHVVPWLAAALIVGLLARASLTAWLLTGAVVGLSSLAYLGRRQNRRPA
jgi:amino acid transporter